MEKSTNTMPISPACPQEELESYLEPAAMQAFLQTLAADKHGHIHYLEIIEQVRGDEYRFKLTASICRTEDGNAKPAH